MAEPNGLAAQQGLDVQEGSDTSDAELEAAIQVESDNEPLPPQPTSSLPAPLMQATSIAVPSTSSPFKAPPNPSIPQDLSLIMEMVSKNEVVGSLPPISMSAAEKRKLVEQSLKSRTESSKAINEDAPQKAEVESDSDSSSSFVSSSEDESDDETQAEPDKPMDVEDHAQMKKDLDAFMGIPDQPQNSGEVEMDSEYETDSDDDDEGDDGSSALDKLGFQFMEDDEDDVGPSTSGPITSTHEAPLPAVAQPPLTKLPDGEGVSLAGDVVSWMREKKVELWLEKQTAQEQEAKVTPPESKESAVEEAADPVKSNNEETSSIDKIDQIPENVDSTVEDGELNEEEPMTAPEPASIVQTISPAKIKAKEQAPKFTSSGTVVVQAMQSRPGAADEGWLEEGSVLCWEDGRVLGTVHETFGPLTSPFYTIRLPPPPHPYPSHESLSPGTRLYYPLNPSYRSFVNMLAVRDPRFKGSDASNLYDEEIGEDEIEWSDDEMEAEAKRRRKQRKGSKIPLSASSSNPNQKGKGKGKQQYPPHAGQGIGLPERPHFDYHDPDEDDTGSLYGGLGQGEGGEDWETSSMMSSRSRNLEPYDLDEIPPSFASASEVVQQQGGRGGRGDAGDRGRGRGRGQGRERGRGRGRGGGRGGSTASGGGHQRNHSASNSNASSKNNAPRQGFALPQNPMTNMMNHQQQYNQVYIPQQQQQQAFYPQSQPQQSLPFPPQQLPFQSYPYLQQQMHYPPPQQVYGGNDAYEPSQPSSGMPSYQTQPQQSNYNQYSRHNSYSQGQDATGVPAINPRFAAQYSQQMMGSQSSPAQGYEYNYPNQGNQYSE
ncbi:uncharacterized protein I303_108241 [Kwoniella dejecticola CBS 10117]|uniref:H/ACA ribonucleoprotein complex non-core subunit NAF1 n=1 Tax=Kwoniella dejecticola CBS 10117 TaxID=1296121 RepID=A0A1A5ZXY2_9TREE|nr:uncharacterized protein I303_07433 [Kwoniella dejecticola CBS 10117]OBR82669.1 hypothetical protein I303_07433 [Kwoniella dejecticola CBS 10117]